MAATAAVEGVSAAIRFCSVRFGLMITGGMGLCTFAFSCTGKSDYFLDTAQLYQL